MMEGLFWVSSPNLKIKITVHQNKWYIEKIQKKLHNFKTVYRYKMHKTTLFIQSYEWNDKVDHNIVKHNELSKAKDGRPNLVSWHVSWQNHAEDHKHTIGPSCTEKKIT